MYRPSFRRRLPLDLEGRGAVAPLPRPDGNLDRDRAAVGAAHLRDQLIPADWEAVQLLLLDARVAAEVDGLALDIQSEEVSSSPRGGPGTLVRLRRRHSCAEKQHDDRQKNNFHDLAPCGVKVLKY